MPRRHNKSHSWPGASVLGPAPLSEWPHLREQVVLGQVAAARRQGAPAAASASGPAASAAGWSSPSIVPSAGSRASPTGGSQPFCSGVRVQLRMSAPWARAPACASARVGPAAQEVRGNKVGEGHQLLAPAGREVVRAELHGHRARPRGRQKVGRVLPARQRRPVLHRAWHTMRWLTSKGRVSASEIIHAKLHGHRASPARRRQVGGLLCAFATGLAVWCQGNV